MNKNLVFIDNDSALLQACRRLKDCAWLAVDTEFERVSTYYPELCLLQFACKELTVVIDPLAVTDLEPVYEVLYDPAVIKVFHAARQDLEIFFHTRGDLPVPVFDTQIAAPLLGYDNQIGYANLIRELLGVELTKTQTRTDWKRRPLSSSQLEYAADDVIYLGQAYEKMSARLNASGQLSLLVEEFRALLRPELYQPDPENMWQRIKKAEKLNGNVLVVLQQLAAWREVTARAENRPRSWILRDYTLVEMAQLSPANQGDLARINGMNRRALKRHGATLIKIIEQAGVEVRT